MVSSGASVPAGRVGRDPMIADRATPTVTVALCTYEGEAWLPALFGSLERQTLPPTEVVVCDDASTDGTVAVLRELAARAPWPVRVTVNPVRLGFSPNFEQAVRLAAGEVIALADQDDVWAPAKLERLVAALRPPVPPTGGAGQPGLVFSDADLVDEDLRPLGRRAWEALGITDRELAGIRSGSAFRVLLRRQRAAGGTVPGATMAFAGQFREVVLPFPDGLAVSGKGFAHDAWITLVVAAMAPVVALAEPLVAYRSHPGQQIGLADRPAPGRPGVGALAASRPDVPAWASTLRERLQDQQRRFPCPASLELLAAMVGHLEGRAALPARRWRRVVPVARELVTGRYGEWSSGVSSALADLAR